jgi:hypothetical protein
MTETKTTGAQRYIGASERSMALLEGAILWGRFMDCCGRDERVARLQAFDNWKVAWGEQMAETAIALQGEAFGRAFTNYP